MIVKLTAALVKRNTDSLLAKCKSGSIFIILRTRVCGNCVNRPTEASSFCGFPSVESTACSTSSAILNLKLAGKNLVSSPCCVIYPRSSASLPLSGAKRAKTYHKSVYRSYISTLCGLLI